MKIRIGNDIKLRVKLLGKDEINSITINSVKAYIINTSVEKIALENLQNKTKFISRFPIEPEIDMYCSTSYNINSSGYPSYHAFPKNHVIGSYAGFGTNPNWSNIYKAVPDHNFSEYLAPVKATADKDVIEVYFPAEAQLYTGDYKIVVVAKLYEPGFSLNNLRTVTMDYENVFTLVNTSEEGVDSAVSLNVGEDNRIIDLQGDTDVVVGSINSISIDNAEGVKWYCKESFVRFMNEFKNTVLYTVSEIPNEGTGANFTIYALSNDGSRVIGKINVFAHNFPTQFSLNANKQIPSVGSFDMNYNDSIIFHPVVTFENGDIRSYTYQNGIKVEAVDFTTSGIQAGDVKVNKTFVDGILTVEFINKHAQNKTDGEISIPTILNIQASVVNATEQNPLSKNVSIRLLETSAFTGDVYSTAGSYNSSTGRITIDRTDGESKFNIDMSSETAWHEGD